MVGFTPTTDIRKVRVIRVVHALLFASMLAACADSGSSNPSDDQSSSSQTPTSPGSGTSAPGAGNFEAVFVPVSSDIRDADAIYQQDGYGTVDVVRMDVRIEARSGLCTVGEYDGCTLADVISDVDPNDAYRPRVAVHFTADDFPEDGSITNATFFQRGGSTRLADQKSFRIRLDDKDKLWRGERSILLNKHPFERSRIRNKLAFDLMSEIPHLPSSRTQFVNLWIDNGAGSIDYGLFTHVEAPGSNYLEKRGFRRSDRLYKTDFFNFSRSDLANVQVDSDGKPLDMDRFERSLEIEAGEDHRTLVQMLAAMHDPSRSFESILDQYFNRNNVLTWIAVNFLLHQTDAVTHNFILFNPEGSETFYFLPWDYDGGFSLEIEPPADSASNQDLQRRLYYGYARGSNSEFHRRYYSLPGTHQRVLDAADQLRQNYLTDANITEKAVRYEQVVRAFATRPPDSVFNSLYDVFAVEGFDDAVAGNQQALMSRFSVPMPPRVETPELVGSQWVFRWSPAVEVTGNSVSYDIQISKTVRFEPDSIVYSAVGVGGSTEGRVHRVDQAIIQPIDHYVRVIARAANSPQRFWQVPSNAFVQDGIEWFGLQTFRGR